MTAVVPATLKVNKQFIGTKAAHTVIMQGMAQ
jgi:hypothetical protein